MSALNWLEVLADPIRLRVVRALLAEHRKAEPKRIAMGRRPQGLKGQGEVFE